MNRSLVAETVLVVIVLLGVAALYAEATTLSWTYDDAFLLRVVNGADLNDYFGSRPFWQSMPSKMFVPLLLAWYELGSRAGDAKGFYMLAIALLAVSLVAVYLALRTHFGRVESLAGVAMIGLGPPVVSLVTQLMATHYLVALAFSALAFAVYVIAIRRDSMLLAMFSAVLYLAAMLAKEVAVPLPALLLLVPRSRWRMVVPHAVAFALYMLWRKIMLGVFLGGYGWAVTSDTAGPLIVSLPLQLVRTIAPPQWWLVVLVAIALLVPIAAHLRSRRFAFAFLVALGCAILPVLPVSREMQPRYAFAAWVTLVVFFVIAVQSLPRRTRAIVCALAVAVVAITHRAEWDDALPLSEQMSAETRFVLSAPADATLRLPKTPPAAMGELQAMRGATGPLQWFYDDMYLCAGRHQGRRLYQSGDDGVVEITSEAARIAQKHCTSIREDVALSTRFRFESGTLRWTFGPYEEGKWHVVFGDGVQAFAVPREDAYILGEIPGISLRVRYDSPAGWVTYSPELALDFTRQKTFEWHR